MKPHVFDYVAATSIDMALAALADAAGEAKILAGGQSLMPMLNFRLLRPSILVDINRISGLGYIEDDGATIRIGALTRHFQLETSAVIARQLLIVSASGKRMVAARDFFLDALTVDLGGSELLTEIALPKLPRRTGWGFEEVARRHGDFALAAVAATLTVADGAIVQARIALTGVGPTPLRAGAAEALLVGRALDRDATERAIEAVGGAVTPDTDLHGSSDYRRHLAGVLVGRALAAAWRRATTIGAQDGPEAIP